MWGEYRKICHKIACHFFMMTKIFNPSLVCHLLLVTVFGKELQHQLTCRMDATHMEVLQRWSWSVHASLCTWQHSHVKIYHKSSLLFLPDPGLEYDILHLTLRVFFESHSVQKYTYVLWKDWQSGLYSLESHCSFLEVAVLKMHHVQHDFTPFLAWQVFFSGLFLPSHVSYFTMIVCNFLLGSFLHEDTMVT